MASKPIELPLAIWSPPASPLRIEYSSEVIEEIRARAAEGFYKLTRGGVEIAGLLLGSVQQDSIRVLAQIPFEIEYAYGPVFALSPRDVAYVRKLIEDVASANVPVPSEGKVFRVLGLYISHSRSGMTLTEGELQLCEQLFPHAWQTVLVVKPSRGSETAAAFFVRERNGELQANQPYGHFVITPAMGERRARPSRGPDPSLAALAGAARNASSADASTPAAPHAPAEPAQSRLPNPSPPPALSDEDYLARRALPESPPAPPPIPPSAAVDFPRESQAEVFSSEREEPAAPETSHDASRELELLSLPRPLAALVVEPDAPPSPPPALPSAEPPAAIPDSPQWHEEEAPVPRLRATSWLRWAIPSVGLVLLLVLGFLVYHALKSAPPTVVFYTRDAGENLEVIWQLKGLSDAHSAVITVRTGNETRRIDLIRTGQLSGTYKDPFLQRTSDVVLDVERASGEVIHRSAPLIPADSVVAYLGGAGSAGFTPPVPEGSGISEVTGDSGADQPPGTAPEPILATPVETEPKPATPASAAPSPSTAAPPSFGATAPATSSASSGENERRSGLLPAEPVRAGSSGGAPDRAAPEAPVQARITEAPVASRPETPRPETTRPEVTARTSAQLRPDLRPQAGNAPDTPASVTRPTSPGPSRTAQSNSAQTNPSVQSPPPAASAPVPDAPRPAITKPAPASISAGRMIWTGQLGKNQSLQINGKSANRGVVSAALPGQPIRVNVLPGELTAQGLVVYTSNPRYRDAQNAVEPPGPTNGWNQTRYRYDPVRAHSLIVIGTPNQANGWQGVTVRNDDKSTNVIVIDWQAAEP